MIWYGILPQWQLITLPLFMILAIATALAISLWLSALQVRYRDIGHTLPFLLQIGLFASPIAYSITEVPSEYVPYYSLNPMVGVISGVRWSLLSDAPPNWTAILIGCIVASIGFIGGLMFFRYNERTFADVI